MNKKSKEQITTTNNISNIISKIIHTLDKNLTPPPNILISPYTLFIYKKSKCFDKAKILNKKFYLQEYRLDDKRTKGGKYLWKEYQNFKNNI